MQRFYVKNVRKARAISVLLVFNLPFYGFYGILRKRFSAARNCGKAGAPVSEDGA